MSAGSISWYYDALMPPVFQGVVMTVTTAVATSEATSAPEMSSGPIGSSARSPVLEEMRSMRHKNTRYAYHMNATLVIETRIPATNITGDVESLAAVRTKPIEVSVRHV